MSEPQKETQGCLLIGVILVLALGIYFYHITRPKNLPQPRVTIAMKWRFAATMAPYFAAQENGIFDEYGLDVHLREGGPSRRAIDQVLLGQAEFGLAGANNIVESRAEDQPVKAVAVIFKESPVCLLSLTSAGIDEPQDLVGKTVAMSDGDNIEFEYRAMLQKAELRWDSVEEYKPFPGSASSDSTIEEKYQRLLDGEVDLSLAYANDQPITLRYETNRAFSCLLPRQHGVDVYADVLFTTEEMIRDDPDRVRRVVFSILEAWEWTKDNQEKAVWHFLSDPKIKPDETNRDVVSVALDSSLEYVQGDVKGQASASGIPKVGIHDKERWAETANLIRDFGEIATRPSIEACYTNRWVRLYKIHKESKRSN